MFDESVESCKVVLLGESGVGKTSIITQFLDNEFNIEEPSTSGATFSNKAFKFSQYNKTLSFEIWDTAGQEKYRSLTSMFYKDASVAILVYDITRENSFTEIQNYWLNQLRENSPKNIIIALAANKSDLYEKEKVDEHIVRDYCEKENLIFKLTSAKSGEGITDLFQEIGIHYLQMKLNEDPKNEDNKETNNSPSNLVKINSLASSNSKGRNKKACC